MGKLSITVCVAALVMSLAPPFANASAWVRQDLLVYDPVRTPPGSFGYSTGYGSSISLYGDKVAVGIPNWELYEGIGAVYVYSRSDLDEWGLSHILEAEPGRPFFGNSVALYEDNLAVGEAHHTTALPGRVSMFRLDDQGGHSEELFIEDMHFGGGSEYGNSVDLAGSTLVTGYFDRNGVLIHERTFFDEAPDFKFWDDTQYFLGEGTGRWTRFGANVATNGDVVAIYEKDQSDSTYVPGSVYLTELGPGGEWSGLTHLQAPEPDDYDRFGQGLAIEGDFLVVGASGDDTRGPYSGTVYIYEHTGPGSWDLVSELTPSVADQISFGKSVAISGGRVIVAANEAAYIFERDAAGQWLETAMLTETIPDNYIYGLGVDIHGDTAIVHGSEGVYVYVVPEPATVCSVLMVLGAVVSRRRVCGL
jgi:FG-GAP repeat